MKSLTTTILAGIALCMGTTNVFSQPPNDHISNAIDLAMGPVPYTETLVSFTTATNTDDNTPSGGCIVSHPGVWYKFTATKNGSIGAGITLISSPDVIFYEGPATGVTSGSQLTYVSQATNPCTSASNLASIQASSGKTYYIYMKSNVDSDVIINSNDGVFAPPKNDLIENANNLNNIVQFNENDIHFLMATKTNDDGQAICPTNDLNGIWYKFKAGKNGKAVAGISTPSNDSAIIFYSAANGNATSGTDLTHVVQATNPCSNANITAINATAGITYYVFAWTELPFADVFVDLTGVMSTQDHVLEGFEFYPNPVGNELNLNARGNIDEVNIYNLLGKKAYTEKIGMKESQLNLGMLSPGVYIMEVLSEGISARYKLVKK